MSLPPASEYTVPSTVARWSFAVPLLCSLWVSRRSPRVRRTSRSAGVPVRACVPIGSAPSEPRSCAPCCSARSASARAARSVWAPASRTIGARSRCTPSRAAGRSSTARPPSPSTSHSDVAPRSRSASTAAFVRFGSGSACRARTSQAPPPAHAGAPAGGRVGGGVERTQGDPVRALGAQLLDRTADQRTPLLGRRGRKIAGENGLGHSRIVSRSPWPGRPRWGISRERRTGRNPRGRRHVGRSWCPPAIVAGAPSCSAARCASSRCWPFSWAA